jgi:hypothetical protein
LYASATWQIFLYIWLFWGGAGDEKAGSGKEGDVACDVAEKMQVTFCCPL